MRQMLQTQEDAFYYVTLMNENYAQPSLPDGAAADVIKGMYRFGGSTSSTSTKSGAAHRVRLLGSGTILREVIAAAELLEQDWNVASEVWSATSFSELARDAREIERLNRLHPMEAARTSHVQQCLQGDAPVIAASDYVRAWPQLIASYVRAPFVALGTDGFGRSDTRAALRSFFEVDRHQIALAALTALREQGSVDAATCAKAIERYGIAAEQVASWSC
jgi:pyruvate dehydrogenase E1 component